MIGAGRRGCGADQVGSWALTGPRGESTGSPLFFVWERRVQSRMQDAGSHRLRQSKDSLGTQRAACGHSGR